MACAIIAREMRARRSKRIVKNEKFLNIKEKLDIERCDILSRSHYQPKVMVVQ